MDKYWYCPSTGRFFHSVFHGEHQIPPGSVSVTKEEYTYLISQNHRGMRIVFNQTTQKPELSATPLEPQKPDTAKPNPKQESKLGDNVTKRKTKVSSKSKIL
jgi:hypothetical protein